MIPVSTEWEKFVECNKLKWLFWIPFISTLLQYRMKNPVTVETAKVFTHSTFTLQLQYMSWHMFDSKKQTQLLSAWPSAAWLSPHREVTQIQHMPSVHVSDRFAPTSLIMISHFVITSILQITKETKKFLWCSSMRSQVSVIYHSLGDSHIRWCRYAHLECENVGEHIHLLFSGNRKSDHSRW